LRYAAIFDAGGGTFSDKEVVECRKLGPRFKLTYMFSTYYF